MNGYGSHWDNSGKWDWTPKIWIWGNSLDDGIRDYIKRGKLEVDSAFCAWWKEQSPGGLVTNPPQTMSAAMVPGLDCRVMEVVMVGLQPVFTVMELLQM